jgi:hypothetical protein
MFRIIRLFPLLMSVPLSAQMQRPPSITLDEAIQRVQHSSSLTDKGNPFHALLTISNPKNPDSEYRATIEVFWKNRKSYRTVITSRMFSQTRIVQGDQVEEHNVGDFYPPWLQDYLTAILNPLHVPNAFQNSTAQIFLGDHMRSCQIHDDRPGGITNDLTHAMICFAGNEPRLESMGDFSYGMTFSDFRPYGKQSIAYTYQSGMDGNDPIIGKLTLLEPLEHPSADLFTITTPTPPSDRIETTAVSTLKEESLVERSDTSPWPPIRGGKTEGYMIVYAVTDRTGQVRSASKYNSDNAELEYAGVARAMHYKFKPLLIDGVPQQMEMPLVLHFSSRIEDPIPVVAGDAISDYASGCGVADLPTGLLPAGTPFHIRYFISEQGKVNEENFPEANDKLQIPEGLVNPAWGSLRSCRFSPYLRDGKPTVYYVLFTFHAP